MNYKDKMPKETRLWVFSQVRTDLNRRGIIARLKEIKLEEKYLQHAVACCVVRNGIPRKVKTGEVFKDVFSILEAQAKFGKTHPDMEWDQEINVWKTRRNS